MSIMGHSLAHGLPCVLYLYELHRRSPGCCCTETSLEWDHGYVMAMSWLHYGYVMAVLQLLHQPGERLCYGCHAIQERKRVSAVPMAPWVIFQPLNLCLAHPGFSKQCEQQDNWYHEQDLQYNHVEINCHIVEKTRRPLEVEALVL